ncbi:DUF3048 domain-containing protein [Candidatus Uhrbacteria bacterium]|nr:DUF3048 domain-containing protein [Candidatus Uhrbacteria bacterium]
MKKTKRDRKKELGIAVIIVTAVFVLMWVIRPWQDEVSKEAVIAETPKVRRAIDGMMVEQGQENPPVAGVLVENMIEAQPISGIAEAALVFEAVTEANITRFLGYFVLPTYTMAPRNNAEQRAAGAAQISKAVPAALTRNNAETTIEIGPVRSARPYFLDWAAEFNTLFAHVGSSPAAYNMLRVESVDGVQDLDQWYQPQYFYAKDGRPRPHHLYTNTELLEKAYQNFPPPLSPPRQGGDTVGVWKFKSDAPPDLRGDVNDIQIGYAAPYGAQWLYDKFENHYKRIQWDGAHRGANGKEIIAKNIAVAFQKMKILDAVGRKEFTTLGEGKGLVFQDGRVTVGVWKKPSARERMRWYDAQGHEVEFNAGVTWIEIVPENYGVRY